MVAPPLADQIRLSHILSDDLQPRINWAYELEQDIDVLGAGYVTVGNGNPNGLVTKPEGYLFLDLTTPAVWQNQNGGTVWTQLGAGGGSGLPDPWISNQTSGEVVATVDGTAKTALTVDAFAGQTAPLQVWKDENANEVGIVTPDGRLILTPTDPASFQDPLAGVLTIILPVGTNVEGGFAFAVMGELNRLHTISVYGEHVIEGATGLGVLKLLDIQGDNDLLSVFSDHRVIINAISDSSTDPFLVQDAGQVPMLTVSKPDVGDCVIVSSTATQDCALTVFGFTDNEVDLQRWQSPDRTDNLARIGVGGAIGTSSGEPADADIANGECFRFFDSTNGAARIGYKGKTLDGTVVFAYGPMGP